MSLIVKLLIIWLVWSLVKTILVVAFDNDALTTLLATGPIGTLVFVCMELHDKVKNYFKLKFKKASIWKDPSGNLYRVNPNMYQDIKECKLTKDYKLVKRYANKREWKGLPTFSDDILDACLTNCHRCTRRSICDEKEEHGQPVLCRCDEYGFITERNHFEFDLKARR